MELHRSLKIVKIYEGNFFKNYLDLWNLFWIKLARFFLEFIFGKNSSSIGIFIIQNEDTFGLLAINKNANE